MIENLTPVEAFFYEHFKKLSKLEKRNKLEELIHKKTYYSEQPEKKKNVETKIKFIRKYFPEYIL